MNCCPKSCWSAQSRSAEAASGNGHAISRGFHSGERFVPAGSHERECNFDCSRRISEMQRVARINTSIRIRAVNFETVNKQRMSRDNLSAYGRGALLPSSAFWTSGGRPAAASCICASACFPSAMRSVAWRSRAPASRHERCPASSRASGELARDCLEISPRNDSRRRPTRSGSRPWPGAPMPSASTREPMRC